MLICMVRQARLAESESTMEQLHNKLQQLEKSKDCNQKESDEMAASLDQAQLVNAALEKKVKQFGIYLFSTCEAANSRILHSRLCTSSY